MTILVELALLATGLVVISILVAIHARDWLHSRRERQHLARLGRGAADRDTDDDTPEAVGAQPGSMTRKLRSAGLRIRPPVFLFASAMVAVLVLLVVLAAFPRAWLVALLSALLAGYLPWSAVRAWARYRSRTFEEKLVDAIGFMVAALEAGEHPTRALATAAEAVEGPVARELRQVVDRLDLGQTPARALQPMVEAYDGEGTRMLAQTVTAKWSAGGELAPVLAKLNRILRDRLALRIRMWSEMAGARLGALMVAVLPYLVIPFFLWRRPDWMQSLVSHPLGVQLLVLALLLQATGILWLRHVLRGTEL